MSTTQITEEGIAETIARSKEQIESSEKLIQQAHAFLEKVQANWSEQAKNIHAALGWDEGMIEQLLAKAAPQLRSDLEHDPVSVLERRLIASQSSEEEEFVAQVIRADLAEQTAVPTVFNGQKSTQKSEHSPRLAKRIVSKI